MRTHLMDPSPYTSVLSRSKIICIELSISQSLQAMNPLHLDLHSIFVLLFWKWQTICGKKLETVADRELRIMSLKNKFVLELSTWSMLWMYFSKGCPPQGIFCDAWLCKKLSPYIPVTILIGRSAFGCAEADASDDTQEIKSLGGCFMWNDAAFCGGRVQLNIFVRVCYNMWKSLER